MPDEFVKYVGPSDIHDAQIVQVTFDQDTISVTVKSCKGRLFGLLFLGVTNYEAISPHGMMLYALAEMQHAEPQRKFVFANWDDKDASALTIIAAGFHVMDIA